MIMTKEEAFLKGLTEMANNGSVEAQLDLGATYMEGKGVPQNFKKAIYWYKKAAENAKAKELEDFELEAKMHLGFCFLSVNDYENAYYYLKDAASKGSPGAQYNLAVIYRDGIGMQKDEKQAAFWFNEAGKAGHLMALQNLGILYEDGRGVEKNYKKAAQLYEKASQHGHIGGMVNLSNLYFEGKGVPIDIERGFELRGEAALKGDKESFNLLLVAAFESGNPIAKKTLEKNWQQYMKIDSYLASIRAIMATFSR